MNTTSGYATRRICPVLPVGLEIQDAHFETFLTPFG